MKTIELDQNTQEWLDFRRFRIGASDAPIIMGVSPWKTSFQLWEEKLGLREPPQTTAAMRRGHDQEPVALQAYIDSAGVQMHPEIVVHDEYDWMMASLDGISLDGTRVVEIKNPGPHDHNLVKDGEVPEKYMPQLQHQLATTGLKCLDYFSYRDGDYALVSIERDDEYIEKMIEKEKEFIKCIRTFTAPPLTERDYVSRDDDAECVEIKNRLEEIKKSLDLLKKQEQEYRSQLIERCDGQNSIIGNTKITRFVQKGRVDYAKIPELETVDLDAYRKDPKEVWRISHNGD